MVSVYLVIISTSVPVVRCYVVVELSPYGNIVMWSPYGYIVMWSPYVGVMELYVNHKANVINTCSILARR